jgi:2-oxoacid:acceptor oxidoreductase gamma subunit (pyruvate/2-ketoisovalerate family)
MASEILAAAAFAEGKFVQAFPAFGIERRGAPVTAFLRMSSSPIRLRCQIENPDHVVILDPTLIPVVDVTAGLKEGGWIIVNSDHEPSAFSSMTERGWRVATVDAADIAARHKLGARTNPIVNTAILGAFASVTELVGLDSVVKAIEEGVPTKPSQNREAAREAFASVQMSVLEGVES